MCRVMMKRVMNSRPSQRLMYSGEGARGFTLVELLVAIGIIAILIGILMPAISGTIESARSVRCKANLRSLVTGLQMYRDDNRGDIPWVTVIYPTVDEPEPYLALSSYLDVVMPTGVMGEEIERIDPFMCPSDRVYGVHSGFSYVYQPSSFMQVTAEPEEWVRSDMTYILDLYTQPQQIGRTFPRGLPVFSDFRPFHVDRDRWSSIVSGDRTGANIAFLDGSVHSGD